jgi:glycosyltransferase involved in cell wall biosynthesis
MIALKDGEKLLTIFIPSYNRKQKLHAAIGSVFQSIENSRYESLINVLVVDDYSDEMIEDVIQHYRNEGKEIAFHMHRRKCAVAEIAMFSCLQFIDTKYAWLIGNDDLILPAAIDYLFSFLLDGRSSFLLLNFIGQKSDGSTFRYFDSAQRVFEFETGADLFRNFGFSTATTTFPCLCFEVQRLKALRANDFYNISPIYSHTFALFVAFQNARCSFIPLPVVVFTINEAIEEHKKLSSRNKLSERTSYYHISLGYIRHLVNASALSGIPIMELSRYREDEYDKNTGEARSKMSGFFAFSGAIAQLCHELIASSLRERGVIHCSREDIIEAQRFFDASGLRYLGRMFRFARRVYSSSAISAKDKIYHLSRVQALAESMAKKLVETEFNISKADTTVALPFGVLKGITFRK